MEAREARTTGRSVAGAFDGLEAEAIAVGGTGKEESCDRDGYRSRSVTLIDVWPKSLGVGIPYSNRRSFSETLRSSFASKNNAYEQTRHVWVKAHRVPRYEVSVSQGR